MTNILLVAPYGGVPGGISRWTSHLISYYKTLKDNPVRLDLVPMGRTMFVNINMSLWERLWAAWVDYRKIFADYNNKLKTNKYNVVHLTSSGSLSLYKDLYMLRKAKRTGAKCITHFRFGRIPELREQNNWEWKMVRKVVKASDFVVVLDQKTKDALNAEGFDNVVILPNPVAPIVEKVVAENKKNIHRNEILFVGHCVYTKGVFELIDAFKQLDKDVKLKMVGHITPDIKAAILDKLTEEESKRVEICGEKPYEDVIKDMMNCDVFVLPTYTEGFPNVVLESMATGCAIVTTPVGAIPQILEPEENGEEYGVLVEPRNVAQLREAIAGLLVNEERKNAMRNRVQKRVVERYNITAVWQQMVDIWNSI